MSFEITKTFRFEAGHRVWKQDLSKSRGSILSKEVSQNKCVNLHGHSYVLEVSLRSDILDEQDMVMDFYHVKNALKDLVDNQLDHSFIIDKNDPIYEKLLDISSNNCLKLFVVDFCPTAEALSKFIFEFLKQKLSEANLLGVVKVSKVVLWETATSKADYRED